MKKRLHSVLIACFSFGIISFLNVQCKSVSGKIIKSSQKTISSSQVIEPTDGYHRVFGNGKETSYKVAIVYYYHTEHFLNRSKEGIEQRLAYVFDPTADYSLWKLDGLQVFSEYIEIYYKKLTKLAGFNAEYNGARSRVADGHEPFLKELKKAYQRIIYICESSHKPPNGSFIRVGKGRIPMMIGTSIFTARSRPHYEWVIIHETIGHAFSRLSDEYPKARLFESLKQNIRHNISISRERAIEKWQKIEGFDSKKIEKVRNTKYPADNPRGYIYRHRGDDQFKGRSLMYGGPKGVNFSPKNWYKCLSVVEQHYIRKVFLRLQARKQHLESKIQGK